MENASVESKGHRAEAVDRQVDAADRVVDRVLHEVTGEATRADALALMLDRLTGQCGEQVRNNAWQVMQASIREELRQATCKVPNDAQERIIGRLYLRLLTEQANAAQPERVFAGFPS
jgi:hypothetical protein